jgi:pyruvate,water dikinase
VIPLSQAAAAGDALVGGKGAKLSRLMQAGYRVPNGFCVTIDAYRRFVDTGRLAKFIHMELGRKSLASMRWEEIWDAALRIRKAFLTAPIPPHVVEPIVQAYRQLAPKESAVRSSAIGEDSSSHSYAGLHESIIGVTDEKKLLTALRIVWASLWSDASLLYRSELDLDPSRSAMAVVVQEMIHRDRSGVGFGRDPRALSGDRAVIEAVPGLCGDLVDGAVDPDRWILKRSTGEIIQWTQGKRPDDDVAAPLLEASDLEALHRTMQRVESLFGWPPDVEWTGRKDELTLLQARPITSAMPAGEDDKRQWYMSLRPGRARLNELCDRVTHVLIPQLEEEGNRFAAQNPEKMADSDLAAAIDERSAALDRWKRIYWDEFIPFAHGVRQLGVYYNDAVHPDDPYEFVGLLRNLNMIAMQRNAAMAALAHELARHPSLQELLKNLLSTGDLSDSTGWKTARERARKLHGSGAFIEKFDALMSDHMDITHGKDMLAKRADVVLHTVIELAASSGKAATESREQRQDNPPPSELEAKLFDAVGTARHDEARHIIAIARLSWRLRDDDNILLGRIENQLLRAVENGAERLARQGRLRQDRAAGSEDARAVSEALRNPKGGMVTIAPGREEPARPKQKVPGEKPRQIIGQPAGPGLATGKARIVRDIRDTRSFRAGEILICDAIQPTMSHVVPLAAGIVERRGGMLIHGAIIARELGIPCVNGVDDIALQVDDGEIVTVDGHLGIVTVGLPEFDLEKMNE